MYLIRDDVEDDHVFTDDELQRMCQMPLTSENFKKDNKYVYNILKAACVKTDAWTWIQEHGMSANGRKAWRALVTHYDHGVGELYKSPLRL